MTVRELILLLEKHDPEMPVLLLRPDYFSGVCTEANGVEVRFAKQYPDDDHWNVYYGEGELETVKVLLMD